MNILELKYKIFEIKNLLYRFYSKQDIVEDRISNVKNGLIFNKRIEKIKKKYIIRKKERKIKRKIQYQKDFNF